MSQKEQSGKVEYLQMIQEPICRMSTISAIFKGFSATIVGGTASISYKDISVYVLVLSFVPVILFFVLDVYYLQLEKLYRFLYDEVRTGKHPVDYSMELPKDKRATKTCFWQCARSKSIWIFYPFMIIVLVVIIILHANRML